MWSGAGAGNPGGKRRPEGAGAEGESGWKEEGPRRGLRQDGNRAEKRSPQERSVIREWRG